MASVSFHSRLAAAPSEPVDVEEDGDFAELPAPEDSPALGVPQGAKQRLRGEQEAPSYNEGLSKERSLFGGAASGGARRHPGPRRAKPGPLRGAHGRRHGRSQQRASRPAPALAFRV